MTLNEVMIYLEEKGSEQTRKIYRKHGASGDFFGVKIGDLKPIQKKEKGNHQLALALFNTNNSDAQYLGGLIAVPNSLTKLELETWAKEASWYMVREYAVAWNLAEHDDCMKICSEWISGTDVALQECGWAAMGAYLGITPNESIDSDYHHSLIHKVEKEIHQSGERLKYVMNGYLIALGGAIPELTKECKQAGERIGKVSVNMGETSCKVPEIKAYIEKIEAKGRVGKKKKTAKC